MTKCVKTIIETAQAVEGAIYRAPVLLQIVNTHWCYPWQVHIFLDSESCNMILNDVVFKVILCLLENCIALIKYLCSSKLMYCVQILSSLIKPFIGFFTFKKVFQNQNLLTGFHQLLSHSWKYTKVNKKICQACSQRKTTSSSLIKDKGDRVSSL